MKTKLGTDETQFSRDAKPKSYARFFGMGSTAIGCGYWLSMFFLSTPVVTSFLLEIYLPAFAAHLLLSLIWFTLSIKGDQKSIFIFGLPNLAAFATFILGFPIYLLGHNLNL